MASASGVRDNTGGCWGLYLISEKKLEFFVGAFFERPRATAELARRVVPTEDLFNVSIYLLNKKRDTYALF